MTHTTIAVIGATSAVAQSVCRELVGSQQAHFILVARDAEKLTSVSKDLSARGAEVTTVTADLGDLNQHDSVLDQIQSADHMFIFHSTLTDQEEAEQDWDTAQASMTVNLYSPLFLMHGFANLLEQKGQGSMVIVSSVAGDRGRASNYWYGTAKGALAIHCQGLRNRLAKSGINVLTVKPGFIDTPMTAHLEKRPAVLWASPDKVASLIIKAWRKEKSVIYAPAFWRYIMWVIVSIPEFIFKRLSL